MKKHIKYYKGIPLTIFVDGRKVGHSLTKQARRKVTKVYVDMLQFNSEGQAKQFIKELEK